MYGPKNQLSRIISGTIKPALKAKGITAGKAKASQGRNGLFNVRMPIKHGSTGNTGSFYACYVEGAFDDDNYQPPVIVVRILKDGKYTSFIDGASVHLNSEQLTRDLGPLLNTFASKQKSAE